MLTHLSIDDRFINYTLSDNPLSVTSSFSLSVSTNLAVAQQLTIYNPLLDNYQSVFAYFYGEPAPVLPEGSEIVYDFQNNKVYIDDTETKLFIMDTDEEIDLANVSGVFLQ